MSKFGDGWEKDRLKRSEDAEFLTKYLVEKLQLQDKKGKKSSFVLNVNADWGFGKTYFLTNWADELIEKRHPVVYFDAWQNDFSKEPLLALISTINDQLTPFFSTPKTERYFKAWYKTGKKLIKPSTPFLLSILVKKALGVSKEELSELFDTEEDDSDADLESNTKEEKNSEEDSEELEKTVSTVVSKAATKMLETHTSTKITIKDFKVNLEELTNHLDSLKLIKLPIFIFVDELDRCRPDYAIELLENIKHLFGVPGVFFVVSTASEQLSHSIKAVYGQSFDGSSYLKRFFDQTYTMHDPDRYSYSEYLFDKYKLDDREIFYSPIHKEQCTTGNSLTEMFAWLSGIFKCGLRDMEQYCVILDSISLTFKEDKIHLFYLLLLIILSNIEDKKEYKKIIKGAQLDLTSFDFNRSEVNRKFNKLPHYPNSVFTFTSLMETYIRLSKQTLSQIFESHNNARDTSDISYNIRFIMLDKSSVNHNSDQEPEHFLQKYPLLIEQAGRLS